MEKKTKNPKLPIFKMVINPIDDSGVDYVALVDQPAIERNWMMFDKVKQLFKADPTRRLISGFLMLADLPIYRRDELRGEYYVTFPKETIEAIVNKFMKNGRSNKVNLMHEPDASVDNVYMIESFMIDSTRGIKTPEGFDDAPDGSWFGTYRVDNQMVWDDFVKTGMFKGFSVEGLFDYEYVDDKKQSELEQIAKDIQDM
jgi:hypothetical protein